MALENANEQDNQQVDQKNDQNDQQVDKSADQKQSQRTDQEPKPGQKDQADGDARYRGMIADLQRERKARQEFEQQVTAAKAELEAERRRVAALAGVSPKSKQELEVDEIRQQFRQVIPKDMLLEMLGLSESDVASFKAALEERETLKETVNHYWERHAETIVSDVQQRVGEAIGGDLTPRQASLVQLGFTHAVNSDPEALEKFTKGNKAFIEKFVQEFVEDWFEPAKRAVSKQVVSQNRRVPVGGKRSVVTGTPAEKVDIKDPKAVEDFLVKGFLEKGGQFGR